MGPGAAAAGRAHKEQAKLLAAELKTIGFAMPDIAC